MQAAEDRESLIFLYGRIAEKCDVYRYLSDAPDRELEAMAIREEIMRLYAQISERNG